MMSRHFRLKSELSGAIAKRLPHAKKAFWAWQFLQSIRYRYTLPVKKNCSKCLPKIRLIFAMIARPS